MLFIRINEGSQKIPWTTRLLMILGGLIVFSLLFFFAFTFFVVAMVVTGVALIAQFFAGKRRPEVPRPPNMQYRGPRKDDDVIDI
ncbi:MAG: hypothetical protein G3M70_15790 [Candidatus Nitronauta litoralis]|uniref:Uncharacterized protein n=1 Tax=Candidatus Nitronauta litoralis TaxID=2705533 RepID=A0A7T0G1D0_9BACT|nr:MAG: hypothetical protein G3M70_15790 [Candidatus Nitronauta litoralis]